MKQSLKRRATEWIGSTHKKSGKNQRIPQNKAETCVSFPMYNCVQVREARIEL